MLAALLTALAAGVAFLPALLPLWLGLTVLLAVAAVGDGFVLYRRAMPGVARKISHALPLGAWRQVELTFELPATAPVEVRVFDHVPASFQVRGLPASVRLEPATATTLGYRIKPTERGRHPLPAVDICLASRLGLFTRKASLPLPGEVRVFPNFSRVAKYTVLGVDSLASSGGTHLRPRRGEGSEFHQLREYRVGDTFRQIDWNASARTRKLITKEYQEERDQQVLFMLDTGRRMLTRDDELSHFDHVLDALLLLSYVALRQGDAVGFLTCGEPPLWMQPRKGLSTLNVLTRRLYELQPEPVATDYQAAAMHLMLRQKRRALIVLLTNIRDEDSDDLAAALKLLRKRHLVLVCSLREDALKQLVEQPVEDFSSALNFASVHHYLQSRRGAHDALAAHGVMVEDTTCQALPQAITNRYLDIKRAGRL